MEQVYRLCDYQVGSGKASSPCGKSVEDSTRLVINNETYFIDLCEQHLKALQIVLDPFTEIANDAQRRTGTAVRKAIRGPKGTTFTTKEVREWLRSQGRDVPDSGRLPKAVMLEFVEAGQ